MKKVIKFIFIFLIILLFNLLCSPINLDEIWNFGFANNIYRGEIPYLDFNMVLTPFYPWMMSLFFRFFGNSMLVFHVINAVLLTGCFYLLDKMFQDKMWLFFVFLFFPTNIAFPNYNTFLFILLVLIIYLEKEIVPKNNKYIHYVIGFLLGISILTKQTVGFFLLFPSLYYWKDKKYLLERFIGVFIPVICFLFFLFFTKSFPSFINLCFLGLFDFSQNSKSIGFLGILYVLLIIFTIFYIKRHPKDIMNYYVLSFFIIAIPIIDYSHFILAFLAFLFIVCSNIHKKYFHYGIFSIVVVLVLGILNCSFNGFDIHFYPNDINHFEYRFINRNNYRFTKKVLKYMEKYKDKKFIFLNPDAYYFRIILDQDCSYLDLINTGNLGYQGSKYLLSQIKNNSKAIYFVNMREHDSGSQTDQNAIEYVLEHGKKIDTIWFYDIYVLE